MRWRGLKLFKPGATFRLAAVTVLEVKLSASTTNQRMTPKDPDSLGGARLTQEIS
jgi:hypothetical protein